MATHSDVKQIRKVYNAAESVIDQFVAYSGFWNEKDEYVQGLDDGFGGGDPYAYQWVSQQVKWSALYELARALGIDVEARIANARKRHEEFLACLRGETQD